MGLKAGSVTATGLLGKQIAPEDLGYLAGIILAPSGSEFVTDTAALLESNWLAEINKADGLRHIVLPLQFDIENEKEDTVYQTSSTGNIAKVRAGKLTQTYIVKVTPFVMSQLNTLNGTAWDMYQITSNAYIIGTTIDNVKFQPQTLQNFNVEGQTPAGGDTVALVPITFTFNDPDEWNARPSFLKPVSDAISSWNPLNLKDPKALTVKEITSVTTGGFTIAIEGYDKVAHEGLVAGDFGIWTGTQTGTEVSITSVTETSTAGTYDVVATLGAATTYYSGVRAVGDCATNGVAGLVRDRTEFTTP
jgi:hypothetical protein